MACGDDTSAIAASWRRCLTVFRLDPNATTAPVRDPEALERSWARDANLLAVGRPCVEQIYELLIDIDCCVMLAERTGLLIECRTNRTHDVWQRPPREWVGSRYVEEHLGTNSIGTCLAEQRGTIIRGDQHFLAIYTHHVGISSPIFGPYGELVGCLSLSQKTDAHDARLDTFLSITLSNFARRIETELFARAHPATRLMLASPRGNRLDALLAVDPDDRVIGATRGARRLLELGDRMIARAPNVDEVFTRSLRADCDGLADVERRAIVRALARHGGNHSAAAKAIGISRSTLYRKLKSYEAPPVSTVQPTLKPRSSA